MGRGVASIGRRRSSKRMTPPSSVSFLLYPLPIPPLPGHVIKIGIHVFEARNAVVGHALIDDPGSTTLQRVRLDPIVQLTRPSCLRGGVACGEKEVGVKTTGCAIGETEGGRGGGGGGRMGMTAAILI